MPDITIRWAGAADADANTDYRVEVNSAAAGIGEGAWATLVANQAATSPYVAPATTLATPITDSETTIVLTDATDFVEGDYVEIVGEVIILGAKAGSTFTGCSRAAGESLPIAHTGAAVTLLHESYVDNDRVFPEGRYALRYRVVRVEADGESVAAMALAVSPPAPPSTSHICVWGICEMLDGTPHALVTIAVTYNDNDNYGQDRGEHLSRHPAGTTSDEDGFWSIPLRKDRYRQGGGVFTITLAPGQVEELEWVVGTLPDRPAINFLET